MKRIVATAIALVASALAGPAPAPAEVRIVTTIPTLAALATQVGGAHVSVESLAGETMDPHFVDGRPSYALALSRADLLVHVGLGLEDAWLEPLVLASRNGRILPGRPGNLNAARNVSPLLHSRAGEIDRRMGDVHPGGNPHFLYDPNYGIQVAREIADRLAGIDPANADDYRSSFLHFAKALKSRIAQWESEMAPHAGKPFVAFHESTLYLAEWLKLEEFGFIEPVPGISPSPSHLADLIVRMREKDVKVVLTEPWYDVKTARIVAGKAGATLVTIPGTGGTGAESYAAFIDRLIEDLRAGFAAPGGDQ